MAVLGIDVAALSITYTGAHTDYGMVTMSDGARYRLLAFTSSGTLSIEQPVNCEVCVVGGGANGNEELDYGHGNNSHGGAGAYMKNQVIEAFEGGAVVVGAAQGVSSIGGVSVAAVSGVNGGTGAGIMFYYPATGDGLSKYPFGDESYELWVGKPHCAGGAAGGHTVRTTPDSDGNDRYEHYQGGDGGTNGGNGGTVKELSLSAYSSNTPGGSGGAYGGGNGGAVASQTSAGGNATYYGSGAGGGGHFEYYTENSKTLAGGSGYQGIVYIRIPEEPPAPAYISDLALGALINVGTDGGNGAANYEIADINNLVPGGVVLVRKNIHSMSAFGGSGYYPDSTLDNTMTSIYNSLPEKLQSKIMDATFALLSNGSITRKVFALTYTMAGFGENHGTAEGKALQLYTSNENRIKKYNGSADNWWLSSPKVPYAYLVANNGTASYHNRPNSHGVVPAFVIPSKTPYDPTPNTDGSYNLIL